jgi:hypothetical protein
MYILASLLVIGFLCNLFIKPVHDRHHMKDAPADAIPATASAGTTTTTAVVQPAGSPVALALAWIFVGIPLAWGILKTVQNAMKLFA